MNKNISIALVALFAFAGITASAQTGGTTSANTGTTITNTTAGATGTVGLPPKPTREQMEARAKELRQKSQTTFGEKARLGATTTGAMKANRGEMKDEQQKKRLEKASKKMEMVSKRLEIAIERVQKLSDRVAERLTKLEADGVITTVSRGHLAEAKAKLDEARAKSSAVKLSIKTALSAGASATASSTAQKNVMKDVEEAVKSATKVIQEAHKHVALAISTVKPGQNKPHVATSTVPTTTTATTTQ